MTDDAGEFLRCPRAADEDTVADLLAAEMPHGRRERMLARAERSERAGRTEDAARLRQLAGELDTIRLGDDAVHR